MRKKNYILIFCFLFFLLSLRNSFCSEINRESGNHRNEISLSNILSKNILISSNASSVEIFAAQELIDYLEKITGHVFKLVKIQEDHDLTILNKLHVRGSDSVSIYVGSLALRSELIGANDLTDIGDDGFVIRSRQEDNLVLIAGLSDRSILYGVYDYLEHLGVRWFLPDDLGTIVPTQKKPFLPIVNDVKWPDFELRGLDGSIWGVRNKLNFITDSNLSGIGIQLAPTERMFETRIHVIDYWLPPEVYFESKPEYYAFTKGGRDPFRFMSFDPDKSLWKLEVCDENVAKKIAENICNYVEINNNNKLDYAVLSPLDGLNFSEAASCEKYDEQRVQRWQRYSRRYYDFYNRVARDVKQCKPDVQILAYAYHFYNLPPGSAPKAENNLSIMVAHYNAFDLARPMNDETSSGNQLFVSSLDGWQDLVGNNIFVFEYYWKLNWLGLPWPIFNSIAADIPYLQTRGVKGLLSQSNLLENQWTLGLNYYVAAKLLWDSQLDPNALKNEWIEGLFQEVSLTMKKYYQVMEDQMVSQNNNIPGKALRNAEKVFTPNVLREMRKYYDISFSQAISPNVKERLTYLGASLEYTEKMMKVLQLRSGGDIDAAIRLLDQIMLDYSMAPDKLKKVVSKDIFSQNYLGNLRKILETNRPSPLSAPER